MSDRLQAAKVYPYVHQWFVLYEAGCPTCGKPHPMAMVTETRDEDGILSREYACNACGAFLRAFRPSASS